MDNFIKQPNYVRKLKNYAIATKGGHEQRGSVCGGPIIYFDVDEQKFLVDRTDKLNCWFSPPGETISGATIW